MKVSYLCNYCGKRFDREYWSWYTSTDENCPKCYSKMSEDQIVKEEQRDPFGYNKKVKEVVIEKIDTYVKELKKKK